MSRRTAPDAPATPALDKLHEVAPDSQKIGEFLDWLGQQGIVLAYYHQHEGSDDGGPDGEGDGCWAPSLRENASPTNRRGPWCCLLTQNLNPYHEGTEKMLARYFGVDLKAVEDEQRAILAKLSRRQLELSEEDS